MENSTPYFGQWESPKLIEHFISHRLPASADPLWAQSGAENIEEYVRWSCHLCGMACLKMILAALHNRAYPLFELMRRALHTGAYIEIPSRDQAPYKTNSIKGLIYAPFVTMIESEFSLQGEVITGISAADIPAVMARALFYGLGSP